MFSSRICRSLLDRILKHYRDSMDGEVHLLGDHVRGLVRTLRRLKRVGTSQPDIDVRTPKVRE